MTLMNEAGLSTMGSRYLVARIMANMRQSDVAAACGVSRQAVAQWEAGQTEPSASRLVLLARATKQPLDWFAEGLDSGDVRPKGLEPLTFWLGVGEWTPEDQALYRAECDAFQLTNQPDGSRS